MVRRLFVLLLMSVFFVPLGCSEDSDTSGGGSGPVDRSGNLLSAGASGADILANTNFERIRIEIAYVNGFRPTDLALENLEEFLRERTFKEDISFTFLPLASPGEEDLTLQEIASLESENRTSYNDGSTLAVYIYFADAPSVNDDESEGLVTLGAVYRNTSMVIHESTIRALASKSVLIAVSEVESTALIHEFGHLFGLVDLGTPMVNPHEDPEASNHCDVEGCLMRAELEFGSGIMSVLEKRAARGLSELPALDAECIRDLQAVGGR
jgi:hypothetical protein